MYINYYTHDKRTRGSWCSEFACRLWDGRPLWCLLKFDAERRALHKRVKCARGSRTVGTKLVVVVVVGVCDSKNTCIASASTHAAQETVDSQSCPWMYAVDNTKALRITWAWRRTLFAAGLHDKWIECYNCFPKVASCATRSRFVESLISLFVEKNDKRKTKSGHWTRSAHGRSSELTVKQDFPLSESDALQRRASVDAISALSMAA